MCGKFTALASWSEVVAFSEPLTQNSGGDAPDGDGSNDEIVIYRVGALLPVIVWDAETRARRVVKMRWGFPDPRDWRRPRPIHARSETIEAKEPFRTPFHAGQRCIVIFRTFNESEEVVKPSGRMETRQWTIDPKDGQPRGFAFVWRRFEIPDLPVPILACVMATVPANELIRRTIKTQEDDPRMPAILEDDAWSTWLGEDSATPVRVKARPWLPDVGPFSTAEGRRHAVLAAFSTTPSSYGPRRNDDPTATFEHVVVEACHQRSLLSLPKAARHRLRR